MSFSVHKADWREQILSLPVFDTHTHMNKPGVPVAAQNVWDIVEYFWFRQELESVGYPKRVNEPSESERIDSFVEAFSRTRNTTWAQIVREVFRSLYGIELSDGASVRRADEAVRATGVDATWPRQVVDRLNIRRIATNIESDVDYPDLPGVGAAVPLWEGYETWITRLCDLDDPRTVGEEAIAAVRQDVAGIAERGYRGMRVHVHPFERGSQEANLAAVLHGDQLPSRKIDESEAHAFLAHTILRALSEQSGMFAQLFVGITPLPGTGEMMGVGNSHTIPGLYPLFRRYDCDFELVAGAPRLNMDIVQVSRIYPNVHAGGLWWYNFRTSTYLETLQARLEAVPAEKSVILASDGRCIEWCYAKTLLVKNLLADFLYAHIEAERIDRADALWVAQEWLFDAAQRRYV
ncbi:MAG: hypothetical protein EA383_11310 [Spirochaetaceae bacterium]|nr:MAG: hypothetical protein EA383_11310 [Spirochaetaceae bacterium]